MQFSFIICRPFFFCFGLEVPGTGSVVVDSSLNTDVEVLGTGLVEVNFFLVTGLDVPGTGSVSEDSFLDTGSTIGMRGGGACRPISRMDGHTSSHDSGWLESERMSGKKRW